MQKERRIYYCYHQNKGLDCGSELKQEINKKEISPGTIYLPINMTNGKMDRTHGLFSFSESAVKIIKKIGWEE